jgi:hypothetical protein
MQNTENSRGETFYCKRALNERKADTLRWFKENCNELSIINDRLTRHSVTCFDPSASKSA